MKTDTTVQRARAVQSWSQSHMLSTYVIVAAALIVVHVGLILLRYGFALDARIVVSLTDGLLLWFILILGIVTSTIVIQNEVKFRAQQHLDVLEQLYGSRDA
jgi:hypothetical protein